MTTPKSVENAPTFKEAKPVLFMIVALVFVVWAGSQFFSESDEERAFRLEQEAADQAAFVAKRAADRQAGFHCLGAWDGSHRKLRDEVKNRMRDPDSFEHVVTKVTPVSTGGTHTLTMQFRAKNGFGGMNVGSVTALVQNDGCGYTILSLTDR